MMIELKEKISICYTCCGPTYRKSAYDKLKDYYFDNDMIYYCILTDDKEYFKDIERKNLVVNELKDFYCLYPKLEQNEYFLESSGLDDYAEKFVNGEYLFPFSTYRFNLLQSIRLGVKNVAIMCTDTSIDFDHFDEHFFDHKNDVYNSVSEWDVNTLEHDIPYVVKRLKEKFNLNVDENVRLLDAAGRFFIPNNLTDLKKLFIIWNDVIEYLYDNNLIHLYKGSYVINDEYILAPIYNALRITTNRDSHSSRIFNPIHDFGKERYWRTCGQGGLLEHVNYEEFLKINNLTNKENG